MDGINFLIARTDVILAIECVFELILHGHVVEVQGVVVGCADEVCIRPVQQIGVIVITPPRDLKPTNRLGQSLHFVIHYLSATLLVPFLEGVLSNGFTLQK